MRHIYVNICASYQFSNSLESTLWPGALVCIAFTLMAYTSEHICLPHCTCMSHCTATILYVIEPLYCTSNSRKQKMQFLFTILLSCYIHIYYIHAAQELTVINNVMRVTGICTLHIINICSWTNMPATFHIYIPLHCYCSLPVDLMLLHIIQTAVHCTIYIPYYGHLCVSN